MMSQQIPIFIINLPEAVKRRAFMQQQLQEHKLQGEFFKASRGEDLSAEFLAKFKIPQGESVLERTLAKSELGCIFSHYFLLQKIIAEEIPAAVILEDDAKITPESVTLINNLQQIISKPNLADWDLLHFGYWNKLETGSPFIGKAIYPASVWHNQRVILDGLNIRIGPFIDEPEGTHGYVVTLTGAKHLLSVIEQQPILPFDVFLYKYRGLLRYFATSPFLMRQSGNQSIEQHIQLGRESEWGKVDPHKNAHGLNKIKLYIHKVFGDEEHPLYRFYMLIKRLKRSILKTKRVFARPVMRKH